MTDADAWYLTIYSTKKSSTFSSKESRIIVSQQKPSPYK